MLRNPVAVEKLGHQEFADIASRQEALETTFPSLPDIFYHPIFDFFQKNRVFQQPEIVTTYFGKHSNLPSPTPLAEVR
jgi:hypothetical protein